MFAAKSLTMTAGSEGRPGGQTLTLVVLQSASRNMCRFALFARCRGGSSLFKFVFKLVSSHAPRADCILD